MKIIIFDGVVGFDITAPMLRDKLKEAGDEEIELHIASPGGFVFDGLELFNLIRDHNDKIAKVNIVIKGLAASMASYIALSVPVDQVKAEDNAIFMIHNVWSMAVGDHRDLMKGAKEMESLTKLLASKYASSTGKDIEEIRDMMDAETWFYGNEIKEAGFASDIIEHDIPKDKDNELTEEKARVKNMFAKLKEHEQAKHDITKAAASIRNNYKDEPDQFLDTETRYNKMNVVIDAKLDDTYIEGYAAVFNSWSKDFGGWKERIEPNAFDDSIKDSDIASLNNHELCQPLGRTRSGTLDLIKDSKGIKYRVKLPDTTYANDLKVSIARGDVYQNSFSFIPIEATWNADYTERTVKKARLLEVSPCTIPAYNDTSLSLRAICNDSGIEYRKLSRVLRKIKGGVSLTPEETSIQANFINIFSCSGKQQETEQVEACEDLDIKEACIMAGLKIKGAINE